MSRCITNTESHNGECKISRVVMYRLAINDWF